MTFQPNKNDKYEVLSDNIRIIYLELNKYIINSENINDKLSKWIDFLTNPISLSRNTLDDNDIDKARKTLEYISTTDQERLIIDKIIEGRNDFYSSRNIAKQEGIEEGIEIGLKKGLKDGLKKGLKDGLDKGLKEGEKKGKIEGERNKSIEIARNMLNLNIDINVISKSTGLSIGEIKKILT